MSEPYWSALGGGVVDYEGDWAAGTQYAPGDVVRRNGVNFLAVNPSLGVEPGQAAGLGRGTTLPVNPVDGQEYVLTDSLTAPNYDWRFRYNAGSTHADKWEFVGGGPKGNINGAASGNIAAAAGITLVPGWNGLSAPRAGVYWHEWQTEMTCSALIAHITYVAAIVGVGAVGHASMAAGPAVPANTVAYRQAGIDAIVLTAGAVIAMGLWSGQVNTWTFAHGKQLLTPIRVS